MHYLTQVKTELVVKMMLLHDDTNKTRIELTAINAEIYIREKEIKEWNKALRNIDELLPGSPEQWAECESYRRSPPTIKFVRVVLVLNYIVTSCDESNVFSCQWQVPWEKEKRKYAAHNVHWYIWHEWKRNITICFFTIWFLNDTLCSHLIVISPSSLVFPLHLCYFAGLGPSMKFFIQFTIACTVRNEITPQWNVTVILTIKSSRRYPIRDAYWFFEFEYYVKFRK